ncbi:3-hydroxyisobutyryl-CoA hydrolase, mitochondrial-like [Clavelina lepadiformis]|uniref:3-hydroxyisobutyryl-CoA hydrolase, mitochondrial-like n=1 Tax=Clavelina lepadiformis TaxID=159417 RepID=UPI0040414EB4
MIAIRGLPRLSVIAKHLSKSAQAFPHTSRSSSVCLCRNMSSANFPEDDVLFEEKGGARIITLNRPTKLNALNLSMIKKIYPKMKEWEEDPRTTLIIMKGAGGKAFCAGGDIDSITEAAREGKFSPGEDFFRSEYELNYRIATCHVPYIAFIDGITMGGGVGLSVHGENRVCTERTVFSMPETAIGLFPDVGGSYFLPRLSMHLGLYLALTGYRLKGRDVYKAGVATRMVHSSVLPQLEDDLVALEAPSAQDITDLLRKYHEDCKTGRERDYLILRDREDDIQRLFCADSVEEIFENLEKDGSEWALEQLNIMKKMSPTSLKVTHKQLKLGDHMNLDECLEMEYRIGCNCLRNNDFPEGVRALLVDKDKNPTWKPATLPAVTDEILESYFNLPQGLKELEL